MRQARVRRGIGELVDVIDAGDKVVEMVHFPNPDDALAAART